jgi:hypothetical protein
MYNRNMDELFDIERALKGKRKGGTIEDWWLQQCGEPLQGTGEVCRGRIVDDAHHGSGSFSDFHTSEVIRHYVEENILETRNTYYTLGKPAPPPPVLTDEEREQKQKEFDEAVETLRHFII